MVKNNVPSDFLSVFRLEFRGGGDHVSRWHSQNRVDELKSSATWRVFDEEGASRVAPCRCFAGVTARTGEKPRALMCSELVVERPGLPTRESFFPASQKAA